MIIIDVEQNSKEWLEARKAKILGSNVYNVLSANTATKEQIIAILDEYKVDYPKTLPKKEGEKPKPKGNKEDFENLLTDDMEAELMRRANKKTEYYQLIADRIAIDTKYEYDENDEIVFNSRTMMDRGHELEDEAADIFSERTNIRTVKVGLCVRDDVSDIGNSPDRLIKNNSGKYTQALEIKCIKSSKHIQAYIEKRIPDEYYAQAIQYFVVNDDLEKLYFAFYDPRIPYEVGFHWIEIERSKVQSLVNKYLTYEKVLIDEVNRVVEKLTF